MSGPFPGDARAVASSAEFAPNWGRAAAIAGKAAAEFMVGGHEIDEGAAYAFAKVAHRCAREHLADCASDLLAALHEVLDVLEPETALYCVIRAKAAIAKAEARQ